ncbi:zinc finger BED domain-containing protein RICESLEEPER 2-like [Alnus glutinosa]|uniref:zinc finger BED domain-containing protein RICESLEEPER 2-like n=1 Tax=Alnus glutinosa TaxID=3517 RepID=UPI002D799E2B|nr:zinc finger BED domain-containing protein RICESLEEPER 2-like [Alnus glutinosa]
MSLDSNKGLRQYVLTRWNSTYLMLESAIHYKRAFAYLEMIDKNYMFCPNALEWENVNDISSFLGCFYCAICAFSGTKYPTANVYFPVVALIYLNLKQDLVNEDGYKRLMTSQMISKFEKYWSEFSLVLAIVVVLDPRYNLDLVKYYYTKIYRAESQEYENVTKTLTKLFMEYSAPTTSSSTIVQSQEDSDWEM